MPASMIETRIGDLKQAIFQKEVELGVLRRTLEELWAERAACSCNVNKAETRTTSVRSTAKRTSEFLLSPEVRVLGNREYSRLATRQSRERKWIEAGCPPKRPVERPRKTG